MLVRGITLAALMVAASTASASQSSVGNAEAKISPPAGSYQVAQACGWYAISVCTRGRGGAQRAANNYGGYVIDSSSQAYPNFRGGWFCAVEGPSNKRAANRRKREMRQEGARSAYVKNGC
jgi:hypothetical protein